MRKTSFDSVPEPAFQAVTELYGAAQQMALALLVTTPEIAQAAISAWGAPKLDPESVSDDADRENVDDEGDRPSAEVLLEWAESMRSEMDFASCAKSLVRQCPPLMNTHPGFIQGPLDGTPYPGRVDLALYGLVEQICNDILAGNMYLPARCKDEDLQAARKTEEDIIVKEMVRRELPHPCTANARIPLNREICEAFLKRREIQGYILDCGMIRIMRQTLPNYSTQDDRKRYLVRSRKDGRTVLVRGRSEKDAESAAFQTLGEGEVRSIEIDVDAWVDLGGD